MQLCTHARRHLNTSVSGQCVQLLQHPFKKRCCFKKKKLSVWTYVCFVADHLLHEVVVDRDVEAADGGGDAAVIGKTRLNEHSLECRPCFHSQYHCALFMVSWEWELTGLVWSGLVCLFGLFSCGICIHGWLLLIWYSLGWWLINTNFTPMWVNTHYRSREQTSLQTSPWTEKG